MRTFFKIKFDIDFMLIFGSFQGMGKKSTPKPY